MQARRCPRVWTSPTGTTLLVGRRGALPRRTGGAWTCVTPGCLVLLGIQGTLRLTLPWRRNQGPDKDTFAWFGRPRAHSRTARIVAHGGECGGTATGGSSAPRSIREQRPCRLFECDTRLQGAATSAPATCTGGRDGRDAEVQSLAPVEDDSGCPAGSKDAHSDFCFFVAGPSGPPARSSVEWVLLKSTRIPSRDQTPFTDP